MVTNFGKKISDQTLATIINYTDIVPIVQKQTDGTFAAFAVQQQDLTKKRIRTVTAAYVMLINDETILADGTAGAMPITLPSAAGLAGVTKKIKKIDSTGNVITINTTSSQTIDGVTSKTLTAQWQTITVFSDGLNWLVS
jgi:hypothetical protein